VRLVRAEALKLEHDPHDLADAGRQSWVPRSSPGSWPASPTSRSTPAWRCPSSPHGKGSLPPTDEIVSIYAGVVASFALLCAFGLGVGAIIRNQVGAIIAALAFFFVLSPLPELLPGNIGDYFPAQAIGSLHGLPEETEDGLGQVAGGFVLAAWSAVLVLIGTALIRRRDLNE
jgi:hypothetical protein